MGEFFAKDYTGAPFTLFDSAHLAALAVIFLVNILVIVLRKRFSPRGKNIFRITLAIVLVVNETAWHLWNVFTGQWTIQTMLPLHLCSVLVWTNAAMLFTRNYFLYQFAYLLGIAAAIQALLTPDAGIYGFPHFRAFQTFISHGSIVLSGIYMTFVEGYRPTWKSVRQVLVWGNVYLAVIFVLNQLIGSNYLFVAHKPETASLMDMLGPWPLYILWLELIAIALCLLLYLPFAIRDRRMAKQ